MVKSYKLIDENYIHNRIETLRELKEYREKQNDDTVTIDARLDELLDLLSELKEEND